MLAAGVMLTAEAGTHPKAVLDAGRTQAVRLRRPIRLFARDLRRILETAFAVAF